MRCYLEKSAPVVKVPQFWGMPSSWHYYWAGGAITWSPTPPDTGADTFLNLSVCTTCTTLILPQPRNTMDYLLHYFWICILIVFCFNILFIAQSTLDTNIYQYTVIQSAYYRCCLSCHQHPGVTWLRIQLFKTHKYVATPADQRLSDLLRVAHTLTPQHISPPFAKQKLGAWWNTVQFPGWVQLWQLWRCSISYKASISFLAWLALHLLT